MARKFFEFLIVFVIVLSITITLAFGAEYDPQGPLCVKRVEFCLDKPKGLALFDLRESSEFKKGDDQVYIYIEVTNCKPKKLDQYYHVNLAMDVDIYYQDGICIYSQEEANTFDYPSRHKTKASYLWTKIDTSCLKEGEYKVEMTIRDENSDKETFALTKFRKISEN